MNTEAGKTGSSAADNTEELGKLLEIELIQKRTEWQRTTARNKNLKTLSLMFLFVVVLAGLAGFYFVFMRTNEQRQQHTTTQTTQR